MNKIRCPYLPSKLSTNNKKLDEILDEAADILKSSFTDADITFQGKKVVGVYPQSKKESYKHILKLDDKTATPSQLIERALYCKQYGEIIKRASNNKCCSELMCWREYDTRKSRWKWCIVCPKSKILIVLGETKNTFIVITAFRLMGKGLEKERKKYLKYKNKR